jgi:hypothetical protein
MQGLSSSLHVKVPQNSTLLGERHHLDTVVVTSAPEFRGIHVANVLATKRPCRRYSCEDIPAGVCRVIPAFSGHYVVVFTEKCPKFAVF